MLELAGAAEEANTPTYHRPVSSTSRGTNKLPYFGDSGTGGVENAHFIMARKGYPLFTFIRRLETQDDSAACADLMKEVKAGFGRTLSRLPAVFGVSRQTLYNWLNGEKTPRTRHRNRLAQLAAASRVFIEASFKPTALSLDRTVAQGKSFVELIGQGADGKETAERLVRLEKRGAAAREKLDTLLGDGRTRQRPEVSDMGRPALDDGA
jgi:transcriptional regulator with XRE-family HTH domain